MHENVHRLMKEFSETCLLVETAVLRNVILITVQFLDLFIHSIILI